VVFSVVARLFFNKKRKNYMKKYNNSPVKQLQKGFTFVELLVIMVIIAIIGGIGIQFVLSTQEDKAKLTNARTFFAKDFPNAVLSCMVRKNEVADCVDKAQLLVDDIDPLTEWGDSWSVVVPTTNDPDGLAMSGAANMTARVAQRSIVLCYPTEEIAIEDRQTIQNDIIEFIDDETSWTAGGNNVEGQGYIIGSDASNNIRRARTIAIGGVGTDVDPVAALASGQTDGTTSPGVAPAVCGTNTDSAAVPQTAAEQDTNTAINGGTANTLGDADGRYVQIMYVMRRP
jgi:Tfp pilus assembly protein FimT